MPKRSSAHSDLQSSQPEPQGSTAAARRVDMVGLPSMPLYSKLRARYQTTIPRAVREALDLKQGDMLRFEVNAAGQIQLRKESLGPLSEGSDGAHPDPYLMQLQAVFAEEWLSPADEAAYNDLLR
jgi:AbrB family looped-hinge helix DNA binding protein